MPPKPPGCEHRVELDLGAEDLLHAAHVLAAGEAVDVAVEVAAAELDAAARLDHLVAEGAALAALAGLGARCGHGGSQGRGRGSQAVQRQAPWRRTQQLVQLGAQAARGPHPVAVAERQLRRLAVSPASSRAGPRPRPCGARTPPSAPRSGSGVAARRRRSSARSGSAGAAGGRRFAAARSPPRRARRARPPATTSFVSPRSLWSTRPRTSTTASGSITAALSACVGLEDEHLDLALEVVERREHHLAAALGADLLASATIPPTVTQAPSGLLAELGERAVDPRAQRVAHLGQRMRRRGTSRASPSPSPAARAARTPPPGSAAGAGPAPRPPPRRRRRRRGRRSSPGRSARPPAPSGPRDCAAGSTSSIPLRRRPGRVERAALDQALDRPLVDRARVDPLAEVPDRVERPRPRAPRGSPRPPRGRRS